MFGESDLVLALVAVAASLGRLAAAGLVLILARAATAADRAEDGVRWSVAAEDEAAAG